MAEVATNKKVKKPGGWKKPRASAKKRKMTENMGAEEKKAQINPIEAKRGNASNPQQKKSAGAKSKHTNNKNKGKARHNQRKKTNPSVKIFSLGGLNEIGKNITVIECENDIIVIDCGIGFPDDDMLGVDLVIPDFTYLINNVEKIRGVFITHVCAEPIGKVIDPIGIGGGEFGGVDGSAVYHLVLADVNLNLFALYGNDAVRFFTSGEDRHATKQQNKCQSQR